MRPDPIHSLDDRAITLWRIHGLFPGLLLGSVGGVTAFALAQSILWGAGTAAGVAFLIAIGTAGIRPSYLARTWRYEITPEEIYLQRGWLVIRRTVVPLVRVENVDTVQGPLASAFGVMSVTVSTAAGSHEIPALSTEVAEVLRDKIARYAREARDD